MLVLPGDKRKTHDACGVDCREWWATRRPDELELFELFHDAHRAVEVREGRPDPGPLVPPTKPCSEASRKRAARESAALLAEVDRALAQRHQELRDGLAWSPLPFHTPPGPPPVAPEAVTATRRKAVPETPAAGPRPEPRESAPVPSGATGEATETRRKRRPRRPAGFIDMIGTVPSSGRR